MGLRSYFNSFSAGTVFICQNLTYKDSPALANGVTITIPIYGNLRHKVQLMVKNTVNSFRKSLTANLTPVKSTVPFCSQSWKSWQLSVGSPSPYVAMQNMTREFSISDNLAKSSCKITKCSYNLYLKHTVI